MSDLEVLMSCKAQKDCVLYHYRSRVMSGCYFDRTRVALEENQLDWRTDRRFGQRGEYQPFHFTAKSLILFDYIPLVL